MGASEYFVMRRSVRAPKHDFQPQLGGSEGAGDVNKVARLRAGTRNGISGGNFSDDINADRDRRCARRVATDQAHAEFEAGAGHAGGESAQPFSGLTDGKGESQKKIAGPSAHGGQVAGGPSQRLVSDGFGRIVWQEMSAFEARVTTDDPLRSRRGAKYCSIIADSDGNRSAKSLISNRGNSLPEECDDAAFPVLLTSCNWLWHSL